MLKSDTHRVPVCPGCGAKFARDAARLCCTKCGIPDEVVEAGKLAVARWKKHPTEVVTSPGGIMTIQPKQISKRERKAEARKRVSSKPHRKAHGRA